MMIISTIAILPPKSDSGQSLSVATGTTTNAVSITNSAILGKTLLMVFLDTARISSTDYTHTVGSDTITWGFAATVGVQYQLVYAP